METKSKIALAATASVVVGALAFSLPSLAHDNGGERGMNASGAASTSDFQRGEGKHGKGNFAELSATITGIPATVTDLHDAVAGAHFEVFRLAADETVLPAVKPATGGRMIGIRPSHDDAGNHVMPEITNGSVESVLGFKVGNEEGVSRFALYPTDGSDAILVTVTTDAEGKSTATSSKAITVSYDAAVAADTEANQPEFGKGGKGGRGHGEEGHGPKYGPRGGHGDHDESAEESTSSNS
jgi:hypothetical protein